MPILRIKKKLKHRMNLHQFNSRQLKMEKRASPDYVKLTRRPALHINHLMYLMNYPSFGKVIK